MKQWSVAGSGPTNTCLYTPGCVGPRVRKRLGPSHGPRPVSGYQRTVDVPGIHRTGGLSRLRCGCDFKGFLRQQVQTLNPV